jgi:hypothetical protein
MCQSYDVAGVCPVLHSTHCQNNRYCRFLLCSTSLSQSKQSILQNSALFYISLTNKTIRCCRTLLRSTSQSQPKQSILQTYTLLYISRTTKTIDIAELCFFIHLSHNQNNRYCRTLLVVYIVVGYCSGQFE